MQSQGWTRTFLQPRPRGPKSLLDLTLGLVLSPWFSLLEFLVYWKSLLISLVILNVIVKIVYPFDTTFIYTIPVIMYIIEHICKYKFLKMR